MGFLGKMKERAQQYAGKHPEKTQQGVDKAAQQADERTGGKYSEKIDQGRQKTQDYVQGQGGGQEGGQEGGQQQQQ